MQQDQLAQFYAQRLSANSKTLLGEVFGETIELRSQLEVAHVQRQELEGQVADLTQQLSAATAKLAAAEAADDTPPAHLREVASH